MAIGAFIGLIVAFASLTLRQHQVATGFVLTLVCQNLAYVLGDPVAHVPGPQVPYAPVPLLQHIPLLGALLFKHTPIVYLSVVATVGVWWYVSKTRPGLTLRGLGQQPVAAFARGVQVIRVRYLYTVIGGAFVGLGGAAFSLSVKPGWGRPYGIEGTGWIVLAIVIFGNWGPIRGVAGAYLFVMLQTLATTLQSALPNIPTQVFPTLPFPLMILALLLVSLGNADTMQRLLDRLPPGARRGARRVLRALQASPPASLGMPFERD
jgi:simple sugar transport system permease protein